MNERKISRLHFITTNAATAEQACKGGVDWIQLRLKNVSYDEYFAVGKEVQAICKKYNATFIINDNIKLALALDADGVHVGKEDPLLPDDVDAMLAKNGIIGCTANTIEDFMHLAGKPVSYIGLGPFRFTTTKQNLSPILGIEGYKKIFAGLKEKQISYPAVIGIGGIKANDVLELLATGLHGVAVSGAISEAADIASSVQMFRNFIDKADK
jgi:thiamine-phosphate pyrophosphorylase